MKLKGNIDQIRSKIFQNKAHRRKLPFALKMKELEEVSSFIDEKKWKINKGSKK